MTRLEPCVDLGKQAALRWAVVVCEKRCEVYGVEIQPGRASCARRRAPTHHSLETSNALFESGDQRSRESGGPGLATGDPALDRQRVPKLAVVLFDDRQPGRNAACAAQEGFSDSGVADVAIGFVEAWLRHDAGPILAVRLRGDFIAPAFVLRQIEQRLIGCPLDFASIGARIDEGFGQPRAAVLGLRSLRILAEAVLAAAEAP
jgi:hypothetical protein